MQAVVVSDSEPIALKVREVLVRNLLDCPSSHVVSIEHAENSLTELRPELIVLGLSPDPERSLSVLRYIRTTTQAHVIAVGSAEEPKLILRTMREGANEYLDEAELDADLQSTLERLKSESSPKSASGRVIAVLSPSGGSGSSTLAVNLATVLAKEYKRAALLDLKLESGDLPTLLDLKPIHTLADLCRNFQRLDQSMFQQLFVCHASGVHLLAAPATFGDIAHVTVKGVRQALVMARALFPYVVADLDHNFRDEQTQALRQADVILLVFRLEFTSLRNTARTLEHIRLIGLSNDRVRLVVNRYGQPKEVPASRAEEALGLKVHHYIPDDPKTIHRANNRGVPVVLEKPSARVSRSITEMAMSINGVH